MKDFSKILGVIASALHLDANELETALKDGDDWQSDEVIADKLRETISGQVKAAKDAQLKRGTRESWAAVEKWVKAQGFQPEGDIKGTEMLEAFADHLKGSASGVDGQDKDALAKNPLVKQLMSEAKAEVGKKYEALQADFDGYKRNVQREKVSEVAKSRMAQYLEEGKVLLEVPGAQVSKQQRIEAVSKFLNLDEVGLDDKGNPVFVDPDGNVKTDDFGKPIDFKKHVVTIGEQLYGIVKQDPGKSGGNPNPGAGSGAAGDYKPVYRFANSAEYDAAKFSEPDAAKRAQMAKDYQYQQQSEAAG